ncbi:uncharacterized protein LOC131946467 [Physella acuta]|uniref:uncharacterized protein LOC131946467 n=1 Tax=Physella acuta TaxID=109671 RepID=UPI0027DE16B4|nr:uncharacterized protein LOC131946467 [Physella acuta]
MEEPLKFAEAYYLLKKKEEKEQCGRHKKVERCAYVSSVEELDRVMNKLVQVLNDDPSSGIKNVKATLAMVTESYAKQVTLWKDHNSLNLLHHCILNNKPDIINYLLSETHFFPKSHTPFLNPYAHVAAYVGHKECLRVILQHRPNDFFKISNYNHLIKLPKESMRRFKVKESAVKSNLIEKIKSLTTSAESERLQDLANVEDMLEEEAQKKTWKKSTQVKKATVSSPGLRSAKISVPEKSPQSKESQPKPVLPLKKRSKAFEFDDRPEFSHKLLEEKERAVRDHAMVPRRHEAITVFWDVFGDEPPGIIGGAGKPLDVRYGDKARFQRSQKENDGSFNKSRKVNIRNFKIDKQQPQREKSSTHDLSKSRIGINMLSKRVSQPTREPQKQKCFFGSSRIEAGVRGKKKYKDFRVSLEHRNKTDIDESQKFMNKTPLTLAAEKGHLDCVRFILDNVILKHSPMLATKEPLTLATKARSPESILLLVDKKMSRWDYQSAVLLAIREMYPDCLTALLTVSGKERNSLFDGANLFHVLYSQSLISNYRYEMMPEMTRVLISCKENVNAHNIPRTYPMYTLITCAFNVSSIKQIYYYIECLILLLEAKANPHYSEEKAERDSAKYISLSFTRKSYTSAINCILESAKTSLDYFEKPLLAKMFMKKFITSIEIHDKTKRAALNDVLFEYTKVAFALGLDRTILKALLRYGANPDQRKGGKYAVNVYFDNVLPYLTKFEVINSYDHYLKELTDLMYICRRMTHRCLNESLKIFLDDHLLATPIQALPVCRYFSHLINEMVRSPRPLTQIAAHVIWLCLGRNKNRAKALSLPAEILHFIVP